MADTAKKEKEPENPLVNSPEVEHRLEEIDNGNDAQAEHRENLIAALEEVKEQQDAAHDRAMALAAPIQKVTDGNETAALLSITGPRPVRDVSDAPPPNPLGDPGSAA